MIHHKESAREWGPSESFVRLTRNPMLAKNPPARFEPTPKGPNDVVI